MIAFQFLTIVPVRVRGGVTELDMTRSAAHFPLVGLMQGMALVAADMVFGSVFHPDLVTGLVLLVLVLSTGGFHLDGLADTADALATKGDREKKLAAMKDSLTGPMGVIAIVFALGIKYLALRSLVNYNPLTYYHALLFIPVAGKWAMLPAMYHGQPARPDGLGRIFIGSIGRAELLVAAVVTILLGVVPVLFASGFAIWWQVWFMLGTLGLLYMISWLYTGFCKQIFGGLTGDTIGAIGEISEILFLLTVITWSGHYF